LRSAARLLVCTRTTAPSYTTRTGRAAPLEDPTVMMHFSCDYCGKDMTEEGTSRYVLKMEAFAAEPVQLTDDDLEDDHVEEMARLLNERENGDEEPPLLPTCKKMRFDLCANCFRKFVADPLGRESANKFDFSSN
jgi:hypothetical protein